jgi:hypothetical protein
VIKGPQKRNRSALPIAALVILVLAVVEIALFARQTLHEYRATRRQPAVTTRPVAIDLLPSFVKVFEKNGYTHTFSIPSDAMNTHLDGEFTVDPRPQTQVDMLVVTAAGMKHWQDFLLPPGGANNNTANGELLHHSGNTNADYFQIKMTPGDYFLVFDYGPSTRANTDHYVDDAALDRNYRLTRVKMTLYYDLPAK